MGINYGGSKMKALISIKGKVYSAEVKRTEEDEITIKFKDKMIAHQVFKEGGANLRLEPCDADITCGTNCGKCETPIC